LWRLNVIESTESGYQSTIKVTDGLVRFQFEDVEQSRAGELSADLTVWREMPGVGMNPFSARINALSLSSRETYRRALDDAWGAAGWSRHLGQACTELKGAWRSRPRSLWIEDAENPQSIRFLLAPLILARGPTVWFGDGGTGKTRLALWAALEIGPVLYIDYEWEESEIKRIWSALRGPPQMLRYWNAAGIPFHDLVYTLRHEVHDLGIRSAIVDSAALACGGEPEKAEPTTRYFNALQKLKLPSLTLAHVTKAGEDRKPFGSGFWSQSARMTWNVKANDTVKDDELRIGMYCRKTNSGRRPQPLGVRMKFGTTDLTVETVPLWEDMDDRLDSRIRRLLLDEGRLKVNTVAEILGAKSDTVYRALKKMPDARNIKTEWFIRAN
jgi:hypothetical protein